MQFGALVLMLWDTVCGELFEVLVAVRAHFCVIDARVLSGIQVTVQACLHLDGRVQGGIQLR